MQNEDKAENRRKQLKVFYDIKWIKRVGFYELQRSKTLNSNYSYQKQLSQMNCWFY